MGTSQNAKTVTHTIMDLFAAITARARPRSQQEANAFIAEFVPLLSDDGYPLDVYSEIFHRVNTLLQLGFLTIPALRNAVYTYMFAFFQRTIGYLYDGKQASLYHPEDMRILITLGMDTAEKQASVWDLVVKLARKKPQRSANITTVFRTFNFNRPERVVELLELAFDVNTNEIWRATVDAVHVVTTANRAVFLSRGANIMQLAEQKYQRGSFMRYYIEICTLHIGADLNVDDWFRVLAFARRPPFDTYVKQLQRFHAAHAPIEAFDIVPEALRVRVLQEYRVAPKVPGLYGVFANAQWARYFFADVSWRAEFRALFPPTPAHQLMFYETLELMLRDPQLREHISPLQPDELGPWIDWRDLKLLLMMERREDDAVSDKLIQCLSNLDNPEIRQDFDLLIFLRDFGRQAGRAFFARYLGTDEARLNRYLADLEERQRMMALMAPVNPHPAGALYMRDGDYSISTRVLSWLVTPGPQAAQLEQEPPGA